MHGACPGMRLFAILENLAVPSGLIGVVTGLA